MADRLWGQHQQPFQNQCPDNWPNACCCSGPMRNLMQFGLYVLLTAATLVSFPRTAHADHLEILQSGGSGGSGLCDGVGCSYGGWQDTFGASFAGWNISGFLYDHE